MDFFSDSMKLESYTQLTKATQRRRAWFALQWPTHSGNRKMKAGIHLISGSPAYIRRSVLFTFRYIDMGFGRVAYRLWLTDTIAKDLAIIWFMRIYISTVPIPKQGMPRELSVFSLCQNSMQVLTSVKEQLNIDELASEAEGKQGESKNFLLPCPFMWP